MAAFIDYINTPSAMDYSTRSRGTDKARPNDAFGTLFEGIGKVVDSTVKTIDQRNIDQIKTELGTGVDAIRGSQGVDAAVNDPMVTGGGNNVTGGPSGPSATPPAVNAGVSEIARLSEAYRDGRISDTYYFAKIESEARRLRAKFPGYRDEIDKEVSGLIGTNPANALRSSIIRDLKEAQSTAASRANSDEAIIERGKEHLTPDQYNRWLRDKNPAFVAELKTTIQSEEAKKAGISSLKSQYELKKAQGSARQEEIEGIATQDATDTVFNILNTGIAAAGGQNLSSLTEKINQMATGKALTPEEMGQLRSGFAALMSQTELALNQKFSARFGKDGQYSYNSELRNPERIKQIKELAMAPIRAMEKALNDNDTGMFAWHANQAKLMKDSTIQQIYSRSNAARNLAAAQEILGPSFGALVLNNDVLKTAVSDITRALVMDSVAKGVVGNSPLETQMLDNLREVRSNPNARGLAVESTKGVLDTYRRILTNKATDDTSLRQMANTTFNPDRNFITNKDLLTGNSQQSVLASFTNPDLVENLSRLKSSDPQAWENYKRWLESSTQAVFTTTLGQLAEWQKGQSGVDVVVDNQGRISVTAQRTSAPGGFMGAQSARDSMVRGFERQLGQLNSAIAARRLIAQKDGQDPNQVATTLLNAYGLRPTQTEGGSSQSTSRPNPDNSSSTGVNPGDRSEAEATVRLANASEDDMIQLADTLGPVDLDAQEARRGRTSPRGPVDMSSVVPPTADLRTSINIAATELGISPIDLATVISYETGGSFDPAIRGGVRDAQGRGKHIGLIQFGPSEQGTYGANQQQSVGEQMQAVVRYLRHRGVKPGMGLLDVYSTVNAGAPGLYNRSDAPKGGAPGTVRDKVDKQMAGHRKKALALLGESDTE